MNTQMKVYTPFSGFLSTDKHAEKNMSSLSSPDLNLELKCFLNSLCNKLSTEESDALITIEGLPARLRGEPPLDILMQLKAYGLFSAAKLKDLAKMFKNINRFDLAKEITEYSPKKVARRSTVCFQDPNESNIERNLKVARLQCNSHTF